ncbi:hypothetical protein LPW11_10855 [Geomonas sp. RF6]|uniref:hypothetical protein n=1 Tax=Geomonas sp. RF6 TaxID=2897342 RepID=UPI001E3F683A|nr:hypothetical protein [Geomonas sp. RF6]UFS72673.1 hypothetical protein LPW11_10855 [Geomonas sp. RF6]
MRDTELYRHLLALELPWPLFTLTSQRSCVDVYMQRIVFNTDVPTLMHMFNHSSQKQTLSYLRIQPSEVK